VVSLHPVRVATHSFVVPGCADKDRPPPARVGRYLGMDVEFKSWLEAEPGGATRACLQKTGASLSMFAYRPLTPE
jgi:hypothetical protein